MPEVEEFFQCALRLSKDPSGHLASSFLAAGIGWNLLTRWEKGFLQITYPKKAAALSEKQLAIRTKLTERILGYYHATTHRRTQFTLTHA